MKSPPACLVIRYAYNAVRKFPTCILPVGLGANLVLIFVMIIVSPVSLFAAVSRYRYLPWSTFEKGSGRFLKMGVAPHLFCLFPLYDIRGKRLFDHNIIIYLKVKKCL